MRFILFIALPILFVACSTKQRQFDSNKWYQQTKDFILKESNLPTDSTLVENYESGKKQTVKSFNNGQLTFEKWYRETGEQGALTYYSRDGKFELRREICQDGKIAFEGVFYQGNAYGLSTWWDCGKFKKEEGIRFKDKKIGIWKNWNDSGEVSETDYKNNNLIDSLLTIKNFDAP